MRSCKENLSVTFFLFILTIFAIKKLSLTLFDYFFSENPYVTESPIANATSK